MQENNKEKEQSLRLSKKKTTKEKKENLLLLILSIVDLIAGVLSLIISDFSIQLFSITASVLTFILVLKMFIVRKNRKKENGILLIIGILDIITGILSVVLAVYAVQIISMLAGGLTFMKAMKIFIQSEKAIKILDSTKPVLFKIIIRISPIIGTYLINKICNIKNRKGEYIKMEKNQVLEKLILLGNYLKRNVKTNMATIGNLLACLGVGGLVGGGFYVGEVQIPQYATIIISIIISAIIFVFNEFGILGKGKETQNEYDYRIDNEKIKKEEKEKLAEAKAYKAKLDKEEKEKLAKAKAYKAKLDKENKQKIAKAKLEEDKQRKAKAKAENDAYYLKLYEEKIANQKSEEEISDSNKTQENSGIIPPQ